MLFPHTKDFVDYAAVDEFVSIRTRSENLVTAISADVYKILNSFYEMKKKICCLSVLYV